MPAPRRHLSRRRRRVLGPVLLIGALVAVLITVLTVLDAADEPGARPPGRERFDYPILNVPAGTSVPFTSEAGAGDWLARMAKRTDIPERTLRAYADAEIRLRASSPGCAIGWSTLAGIGRAESHHGRFGGSSVADDGTVSPPIIGVALDGSPGVRAIKDTDGGRLDGDRLWDRAVGAMQFLPATWAKWAARANGDGQPADPQNIDDATFAAARYLCASGGSLSTGKGWWKAVLTYNESRSYARDVFSAADAYARASAALNDPVPPRSGR